MPIDPATLTRYQLFCLPIEDGEAEIRRTTFFVVLAHQSPHVVCLRVQEAAPLRNNPKKSPGCVFYSADEMCDAIPFDVAISVATLRVIPHQHIVAADRKGTLGVHGTMPEDFDKKLRDAIQNSKDLEADRRKTLLKLIQ